MGDDLTAIIRLILSGLGAAQQEQQATEADTINAELNKQMTGNVEDWLGSVMGGYGQFGDVLRQYMGRNIGTALGGLGTVYGNANKYMTQARDALVFGKGSVPNADAMFGLQPAYMAKQAQPDVQIPTSPEKATKAKTYDRSGAFPMEYLSPEEQAEIKSQMGENRKGLLGIGPRGEYSGKAQADVDKLLWNKFGSRVPTEAGTGGGVLKEKKPTTAGKKIDATELLGVNGDLAGRAYKTLIDKGYQLDWSGVADKFADMSPDEQAETLRSLSDKGVLDQGNILEVLGGLDESGQIAALSSFFKPGLEAVEGDMMSELDPWLQGYKGRFEEGMSSLADMRKQSEDRWTNILKDIDTWGTSAMSDLNQSYKNLGGAQQQDLVSRGLTGTTIKQSVQQGLESNRQRDIGALGERISTTRAGMQTQQDATMNALAQSEFLYGAQMSQDFLNQLGAYTAGIGDLNLSGAQATTDLYNTLWGGVVNTGMDFTNQFANLSLQGTNMINNVLAQQQAVSPGHPNLGDLGLSNFDAWQSSVQATQAQQAAQPSFWNYLAGPVSNTAGVAGGFGLGSLFK